MAAMLIVLLCWLQEGQGQSNAWEPVPFNSIDSMRQLLKQKIMEQLNQAGSERFFKQTRLQQLLQDSARIDSMGKMLMRQLKNNAQTRMQTDKTAMLQPGKTARQLWQQQLKKLEQAGKITALIRECTGMTTNPVFRAQGGTILINGQVSSPQPMYANTVINSSNINVNGSVMGLPIGMQFTRKDLSGPVMYRRNAFSFQFDREDYLNALRNKVGIKPSALLPSNELLLETRSMLRTKFTAFLDSLQQVAKGIPGRYPEKWGSIESMLSISGPALKDQLFTGGLIQEIVDRQDLLTQLQQQINSGHAIDRVGYDSLLSRVQAEARLKELLLAIDSFKTAIDKSGILQELRQRATDSSNQVREMLHDPDKLKSLVKEQLDLNGLQRFFLNISQLKMGLNTVNLSPLTVSDYINNGVNLLFNKNKAFVFIMMGQQTPYGDPAAGSAVIPLFSLQSTVIGARIGKGEIAHSHTHLSFFRYRQANAAYNGALVQTVPGNTMVATLSHRVKFNSTNSVELELSKSIQHYDNGQTPEDPTGTFNSRKPVTAQTDFFRQMALNIAWSGNIERKALDYTFHATVTGQEYTNPGSLFLSGGRLEMGAGFKKSFLYNKLQFSGQYNYRRYRYAASQTQWTNYNLSLAGKWKFKGGQYLSLRYQPYGTIRLKDGQQQRAGQANLLSLETMLRKRVGSWHYQHTINLSVLQNDYLYNSILTGNKAILINSMQAITVGPHNYYITTQYTHSYPASLNTSIYDTQLNAEAGLSYAVAGKIFCSTGLEYNTARHFFRQLGIRQSLSGQVNERCTLAIHASLLKNMQSYDDYYLNGSRIDWALQYTIK